MRYCGSGVISHEIGNNEIYVISHEICIHEIFWFWCSNLWKLNPWDTGYWAFTYRYDISDNNSFSQAIKLTRSVQSTQESKKSIQINLINLKGLRISLAHYSRDFGRVLHEISTLREGFQKRGKVWSFA